MGAARPPRSLAVPAALALAFLLLPLAALVGRVRWETLWDDITSPDALSALGLSVATATAATGLCVLVGLPLAVLMARTRPGVAGVLRALVTVPLVLPPMVGGLALLLLAGRTGRLGGLLAAAGVQVPFTTAAVVLAQAFVALPFLVLTVEGVLRAGGTGYEDAAASLGASPRRVLTRVTLPLARPGIVAGVVLCFARAIGEFGATALFAGNAPGTTRTMPLAIYTAFSGGGVDQGTAVALALLLLITALVLLVALRPWRSERTR